MATFGKVIKRASTKAEKIRQIRMFDAPARGTEEYVPRVSVKRELTNLEIEAMRLCEEYDMKHRVYVHAVNSGAKVYAEKVWQEMNTCYDNAHAACMKVQEEGVTVAV